MTIVPLSKKDRGSSVSHIWLQWVTGAYFSYDCHSITRAQSPMGYWSLLIYDCQMDPGSPSAQGVLGLCHLWLPKGNWITYDFQMGIGHQSYDCQRPTGVQSPMTLKGKLRHLWLSKEYWDSVTYEWQKAPEVQSPMRPMENWVTYDFQKDIGDQLPMTVKGLLELWHLWMPKGYWGSVTYDCQRDTRETAKGYWGSVSSNCQQDTMANFTH